jgi:hypothetical protein
MSGPFISSDGGYTPPNLALADVTGGKAWVAVITPLVEAAAASLFELGHDPALVKTERFGPTGGSA